MHQKSFILLTLWAMLSISPVMAENWIPLPFSPNCDIDTDSVMTTDAISTLRIRMPSGKGLTTADLAFDSDHMAWAIAGNETTGQGGDVESQTRHALGDFQWTKLKPNTFGKNLYVNYVENPMPHFSHPAWLDLYTEQGVKYHGAKYAVERNTLTYKDGYAYFWMKMMYRDKSMNYSQTIYYVKMNVPYRNVQTLSMTVYDYAGKVKIHGAGSPDKEAITPGTPMEKIYDYIQGELKSGRLAMKTTK